MPTQLAAFAQLHQVLTPRSAVIFPPLLAVYARPAPTILLLSAIPLRPAMITLLLLEKVSRTALQARLPSDSVKRISTCNPARCGPSARCRRAVGNRQTTPRSPPM